MHVIFFFFRYFLFAFSFICMLFLKKVNYIYLNRLSTSIQYKFTVAKNKNDEFMDKLTTSMLIVQNDIVHMSTNMTIFKPLKYSCFQICNFNDTKIIDWICTWSNLIFQPESNKYRTNTRNKKHTAQIRKIKINKAVLDDEITKTNQRKLKIYENHLFNKKRKKNNSKRLFRVKINSKSPFFSRSKRIKNVAARV